LNATRTRDRRRPVPTGKTLQNDDIPVTAPEFYRCSVEGHVGDSKKSSGLYHFGKAIRSFQRSHRLRGRERPGHIFFTSATGLPGLSHRAPGNTSLAPDTSEPPPRTWHMPHCDTTRARRALCAT